MPVVVTGPSYSNSGITHGEKLPTLPPRDDLPLAPPPPPKEAGDLSAFSLQGQLLLPPIPAMSSIALDIPSSPMTPLSPPAFSDADESTPPSENSKKASPLTDLIESEKLYVEFLTGVIRKVAAAWSRSNLPPPQLDIMFRSVEGVYKVNRTLLAKLKEIGENPSSPKALGDLLMRWIDDLDRPYTTYAEKYCSGFDNWEPVNSNPKLAYVLDAFSISNPPPATVVQTSQLSDPSIWTLDALFLLPRSRLQYYRKLYGRLLKSTTPGRSDYRLLIGAIEKLDSLLSTLDSRAHIGVGVVDSLPLMTKMETKTSPGELFTGNALLSGQFGGGPASTATSSRGSSSSAGERLSLEPLSPPVNPDFNQPRISVADLETRLTTEHTLDIFTMQPKAVRLQLVPPMLPFTRELRASVKVVIRLTPKSTGVEVVHLHGHVFILSDLFLVCERFPPEEILDGGPDMRLCYPPLSGKVLKVTEVPEQDNALNVSIMRKETLTLEADSQRVRHEIMKEFKECIAFARAISGAAQEPVPPLPTKSAMPQVSVAPHKSSGVHHGERAEISPSNEDFGRSSPQPASGRSRVTSPTQETSVQGRDPISLNQLHGSRASTDSTSTGPASPGVQAAPGVQRFPSLQNPIAGRVAQATASSPLTSFIASGQVIPPARNASIQSPDANAHSMVSGFPGRVRSPPSQTFPEQPPPAMQMHALRYQPSVNSLHQRPSLPHSPPAVTPAHYPSYPAPGQTYPPHHYPLHSAPGPTYPPHASGPPHGMLPPRPPSEPASFQKLRKSLSSRSLASQYEHGQGVPPPMPSFPGGPVMQRPYPGAMNPAPSRPLLPSQVGSRRNSLREASFQDPSPPTSPVEELRPSGPVRSTISAQMKCKVFHQQQHAQWKSLGPAKLILYRQEPTNVKQLVVEADNKEKAILISTIVLTDGVERVGKTGVAIELSDAKGGRTGIIYMIQLRNESSAGGLFDTLLAGSDRSSK